MRPLIASSVPRRPNLAAAWHTRRAAFAVLLAIVSIDSSTAAGPGSVPNCAGRFTVGSERREFDGTALNIVVFNSSALRLLTDTYGHWTPVLEEAGPYGFMLKHRRNEDVRVGFCALTQANATPDGRTWNRYVDGVRAQLGESVVVSEQLDSTKGPPASEVLGWPTREALFVFQPTPAAEAQAERHVLATGEDGAVLFVLIGPLEKVATATRDFRFFLARLEQAPAK